LAWLRLALVDVGLAIVSGKSRSADAGVAVDAVLALTAVLAWLGSALINVDFTVFSSEAGFALARVGSDVINAHTSVLT
jgi:hypothetical protein